MPRYAAFLRGVSPLNAKMPDLRRAFESAGFSDVRTLLSSGNVVFTSRATSLDALASRAEAAMHEALGRSFGTFVRSTASLAGLVASEPFAGFAVTPVSKRIVTFLRQPFNASLTLPIERDGASILAILGTEVLAAYVPNQKGPAFMTLLERTFGKDITTRTLETVRKCAEA
jgi:uncharacterized protein (DUF1697 family)